MIDSLQYLGASHQLISIVILLSVSVGILELLKTVWGTFAPKIFNIQTKISRRKEMDKLILETANCLEQLKQEQMNDRKTFQINDDDIRKNIELLSNKLDKCLTMQVQSQIRDARAKILDFAAGCAKRPYGREYYNEIFECYDEYEELLKDNNMTNGQVESSMNIIRKKYEKCLVNGGFLEDQVDEN